jgi:transcriptional regulator with XRE-family HTH domain
MDLSGLRRLRLEMGLTLEEAARRAGLAPSTLSRYENGFLRSPRPEVLQAIARGLGISAGELLELLSRKEER